VIVTGYHKEGYEQYGRECFRTLQAYWKEPIVVYCEGFTPDLLRDDVEVRRPPQVMFDFLKRREHDPMMRGELPHPGKSWKAKDRKNGYSFRYDAVKFCKMACYAADAAERLGQGLLAWVDGDCLWDKPVPESFLESMVEGHDLIYLGRKNYTHSDTGFVIWRLPQALPIARQWWQFYADGSFLDQQEWHSAFLFDRAVEMHPEIDSHSIATVHKGNVFDEHPILSYYGAHHKGIRRKQELEAPQ